MPRPSRNLDQRLLQSGRRLYPRLGCAGLTVRAVADDAGVAPGMFHYHFESKEAFLRQVLQQFYDEVYARLSERVLAPGEPLARLRGALQLIAAVLAEHGDTIRRVLADADAGEPVAQAFVRANVPRHLGLLMGLLDEAERAGAVAAQPPWRRMSFLMGGVLAPVLVASRLRPQGPAALPLAAELAAQVLSPEALEARIDMALHALTRAPSTEELAHG